MIAIIAGLLLWCLIILLHVIGAGIGTTGTIILAALGAVLIASYAIQSLKVSTTGIELQTREQTTSPVELQIRLPSFDYIAFLCYLAFIACIGAAIYWSFLPTPNQVCVEGYPTWQCPKRDDPSSPALFAGLVFRWTLAFAAVAAIVLLVKARRKRAAPKEAPKE